MITALNVKADRSAGSVHLGPRGGSDAHIGFGDLDDRRGLCGGAGTRSNVQSELPNLPTELRIGRLQDRM